jgi:hypothetical protein
MDTKELLKKVRKIELKPEDWVIISFRGIPHLIQGTEWLEGSQYQYGDDIRAIDWMARYNEAHVKSLKKSVNWPWCWW